MYCSHCGAKAEGNFCWSCGARLGADGGAAPALETTQDWSHEIRYDALMRIPEVREKVARAGASVRRSMSGEDFLAVFDKVMSMDVPLEKLALIAQPLGERLGLKTGKERSELIGKPPGQTLVAALCSLARHGQTLRRVEQSVDSCLLEAALPSDLWSFEGDLYVAVRRHGDDSRAEAATKIQGQLFDWGKSRGCLDALFADLRGSPFA
jgi:hypothetical protein